LHDKLNNIISSILYKKYLDKNQDEFLQAKELYTLFAGIAFFLMSIILTIKNNFMMTYLIGSLAITIILIIVIKLGYVKITLPIATSSMFLIFTFLVFTKVDASKFDVYQLLSIYLFILFVSILYMRTKVYANTITVLGTILIICHYWYLQYFAVIPIVPDIDDYFVGTGILILSYLIVNYSLNKHSKLIKELNKQLSLNNENIQNLVDLNSKLQASENRFKLISANLPSVLIYQVEVYPDGKRRFSYVSDNIKNITGLSKIDVLSDPKTFYKIIDPNEIEQLAYAEQEAINNIEQFTYETHITLPSGEKKWFKLASIPHLNADKSITFFGVQIDITELKNIQQKYYESQKYFETALKNSQSGIIIADKKTNEIKFANSAAFFLKDENCLLNYSNISNYSKNIKSYRLDGSDYPLTELPLHQALTSGKDVLEEELIVEDSKGNKHWVVANASPIFDENNEIIGSIVVSSDISKIKSIENERNELQSYLLNIINSMQASIISINSKREISHWNNKTLDILESNTTEIKGKRLSEVFTFFQDKKEIIDQVIDNNNTYYYQFKILNIRQKIIFLDLKIYPFFEKQHTGAIVVIEDVTARVLMEEKLIHSDKMTSVGSLAAGMAHEINNPIAGMMQNAVVMYNRLNKPNKKNLQVATDIGIDFQHIKSYMEQREINKFINLIITSGKRASKIINDMLSFARKSESQFEKIDIKELMDISIDLAKNEYDLKKKYDFRKITINRFYQEKMLPVLCDKNKIEQVFLNIIKNGAYAMAEVEERDSIFTINIFQDNSFSTIEIIDNGKGMPATVKNRIFEPFFTTKEVGKGTGLGLSITYFIITENHNGQLLVESVENGGTKFIIKLPIEASGEN